MHLLDNVAAGCVVAGVFCAVLVVLLLPGLASRALRIELNKKGCVRVVSQRWPNRFNWLLIGGLFGCGGCAGK